MKSSPALPRWEADRDKSAAIARLDSVRHPYGPCPAALEALGLTGEVAGQARQAELRRRLGALHRLPADSIRFFPGIDSAIAQVVERSAGPLIGFPPSTMATRLESTWRERTVVGATRGAGRFGAIDLDVATDLSGSGIALMESPSDPLGALLAPADLVRIARSCRLVVVDERYAEFATRSLLPVAVEFDNVLVLRTFEIWAALDGCPLAWASGSPQAMRLFAAQEQEIRSDALNAALATLDELPAVEATLRLLRDERSRLYRLLRKFAFVEPLPSWGPFVTARVSLGSREAVVAGLAERGVQVHAPEQAGLESYIRFGLGTRFEMSQLQKALTELGPVLLA